MWGVYYGMYIVTEQRKQEEERKEYYKKQNAKLSKGEITKIAPFKEIRICCFK